ncbi:MAG: type II toxin-antitoxin system HicB family antitoxin [Polyangiales bacterium]
MPKLDLTDKYTFRVRWSEEDREFVGLCAELPSLSWLAASREAALTGIVKVVRQTVRDMVTDGETPPAPLTDRTYSGVFKVRVPAVVHRNLVLEAAEAGVSLNRWVSAKLAHG